MYPQISYTEKGSACCKLGRNYAKEIILAIMTMIKAITATAMANPIIPKLAEAKTPKYPKITPEIKGAPALYMAETSPPATKKKAQPTKAGQVKMAIRGKQKSISQPVLQY